MKLIALRDFRNPNPKLIKPTDAIHEDHIHKGARFEIDENAKGNDELIAQLNAANAIGDADDEKTCRAIDKEVALEKKKAAADAAAAAGKK